MSIRFNPLFFSKQYPRALGSLLGILCAVTLLTPSARADLQVTPQVEHQTPLDWMPEELPEILHQITLDAFPELANKTIQVNQFEERDAFFQSNFDFFTLFGEAPIYLVGYNPRVHSLGCPRAAVVAILAHELSHTLDYVEGGLGGIAGIGWQILFDESNRVYEHRTDLRAIFRGYGEGLIAYRHWIYGVLNPADLAKKKRTYYQPNEIRALMAAREQALSTGQAKALESYWLKHVPLSRAQIKADLAHFNLHLP